MTTLVKESLGQHIQHKEKLHEDMQQARSILKKMGIPEEDPKFQELKQMLQDANQMAYIGPFTKWMYKERVSSLEEIKDLFDAMRDLKQYNQKVPSVQQFKNADKMLDHVMNKLVSSKMKNVLNSAPNSQIKRWIQEDEVQKILRANTDKYKFLGKFIGKKAKKYSSYAEFVAGLKSEIKSVSGEWTSDAVIDRLEKKGGNYKVLYKSPQFLLLQIKDYETAQIIGNEDICITYVPSQWQNFVGRANNQYVFYNFEYEPTDPRCRVWLTYSYAKDDEETGKPVGRTSAAHYNDDGTIHKFEGKQVSAHDYADEMTERMKEEQKLGYND